MQCTKECTDNIWPVDPNEYSFEIDNTTDRAKDPLPKCKYCSHGARPNGNFFFYINLSSFLCFSSNVWRL